MLSRGSVAVQSALHDFVFNRLFDGTNLRTEDKSWPKITIVTPSFNQGAYLEQTVLSVLNQEYPNLEYIIMDGGSTDDSLKIIRRYEQYLSYWDSNPDGGQSAALAAGFRRATGEILAWINSDDVYLPGVLQRVGQLFRSDEQIDICYGNMNLLDKHGCIVAERRVVDYSTTLLRLGFRYGGLGIYQPASFWRRNLYEKVGGLNPSLFFCMDNDLFIRFVMGGANFKFINAPLYGFRIHPASKTGLHQNIAELEFKALIEKYDLDWTSFKSRCIRTAIRFYRAWKHCLGGDGLYLAKRLLPNPLNSVP